MADGSHYRDTTLSELHVDTRVGESCDGVACEWGQENKGDDCVA